MRLFFCLIFIVAAHSGFTQGYFEGRIWYMNEVSTKSSRIDMKKLQNLVGRGSILTFKSGNFRHDYDGGEIEFDLYRQAENRFYVKERGNDTIFWYDCSRGGKQIKDIKRVPATETKVLNIICEQLNVIYPNYSKVEYYNSDSISVNPEWFAEFKRDDQYKIDAIEKSIFLRSHLDYPAFSIVSTATAIEREPVGNDSFQIPESAILVQKD